MRRNGSTSISISSKLTNVAGIILMVLLLLPSGMMIYKGYQVVNKWGVDYVLPEPQREKILLPKKYKFISLKTAERIKFLEIKDHSTEKEISISNKPFLITTGRRNNDIVIKYFWENSGPHKKIFPAYSWEKVHSTSSYLSDYLRQVAIWYMRIDKKNNIIVYTPTKAKADLIAIAGAILMSIGMLFFVLLWYKLYIFFLKNK